MLIHGSRLKENPFHDSRPRPKISKKWEMSMFSSHLFPSVGVYGLGADFRMALSFVIINELRTSL